MIVNKRGWVDIQRDQQAKNNRVQPTFVGGTDVGGALITFAVIKNTSGHRCLVPKIWGAVHVTVYNNGLVIY